MVLGCLIAAGLSIWLTAGIWRGGAPTGDDTVAHLVRTRTALRLFAAGQADGWQTDFGLGYQQFLFMGSTFAATVALVKSVGLGMISTLGAFKVVIVIAYGLLPVSVAVLALAAGLGRRAAGIAALLSLSVNSGPSGIGIDAVFSTGLVVHQFAGVLVFLSLASIAAVLRRPTRRRAALAGGSVAALIVIHAIAALIVATLAGALAVAAAAEWALRSCFAHGPPRPRRFSTGRFRATRAMLAPGMRRLGALTSAALVAFGLAAAVIVPVAAHGELRGPTTHYALDRLFHTLGGFGMVACWFDRAWLPCWRSPWRPRC